jgi:NADPH:quinone reductase-like Zn-dependent oxidoreductase
VQQIWIPKFGDTSVLEVREAADPAPGPGQVRVRVHGAGVNFADLSARMGLYPDAPPLPMVVGYEVAGDIDAVGEGVDAGRVGEPVLAMTRFGGYSIAVILDERLAVARPAGLDAVTAASIPVVYVTAWMILEVMGRVRAGDRVLVHSAGGGVGLAALDLLRWRGAIAVGTASTGKHAALLERGYHRLVDTTREDLEAAFYGDSGFDLILDPIGGESWSRGLRLLRAGGRIACFGFSSGGGSGQERSMVQVARTLLQVPWLQMNPIALMNENKGVLGVNMGHMWHEAERCRGWLVEILELWKQGVVRPQVHATVPFSKAAEAHRILHARENVGKVVLVP